MSESAISQAILDEIQRLATRFERVEARLESIDSRVANLEGRIGSLDSRIEGLDSRIEGLDNRIEGLDNHIEGLDNRVANLDNRTGRLESRMVGLEARMTNIETVVAALDGRIQSWPDMHFLAAAAKAQLENTREIKTDLADARIRIGEIFQAMPTAPEIRSLREDVTRFRELNLETQVRLGAIEARLGI